MKKYIAILLALVLAFTLVACGGTAQGEGEGEGEAEVTKLKVANVVNGNLGDKSFFDAAETGLATLAAEGVIEYKTFELGATDADQPKWLSTLYELSEDGTYDVIVCGTYQMPDYLKEVADQYPDQKYLIYDSAVEGCNNVVNVNFNQNELGYLVGVLAAKVTTNTDIANVNEDKVVGFVGGQDSDVINDFLWGFIEGAQSVDPEVKIDVQYVGNYWDTAAAKEIAEVMIKNYKCDVVWGVAGGAGNGAAEACLENNALFIGVDSDQEQTFSVSQPELSAITITSGLKNYNGGGLVWFFHELLAGNEYWGQTINLGLPEGGVGIATDGNFASLPDDVKQAVSDAQTGIIDGTVTVGTAFGNDITSMRDAVNPRA